MLEICMVCVLASDFSLLSEFYVVPVFCIELRQGYDSPTVAFF